MGQDHVNALLALYNSREITTQAMKTIRGQLFAAKTEDEREQIMRKVIANVGKRHKQARKEDT